VQSKQRIGCRAAERLFATASMRAPQTAPGSPAIERAAGSHPADRACAPAEVAPQAEELPRASSPRFTLRVPGRRPRAGHSGRAAFELLRAVLGAVTAVSTTSLLGRALFRYRSFTPVPVLAVIAFLLWRSPPTGYLLAGIAVALAGQALRFYTLGQVQDGTSGQDDFLNAKGLNTRGPYARVRNPLYVGNLFICAGLMLVAGDPLVAAIGLAFFFGEYFFIIRAEEDFLRQQFGATYEQYLAAVPRWLPRLSPAYPGQLGDRFDWRRALKKESNPFAAWSLGVLALHAWATRAVMPHAAIAGAIVVSLLAVKVWKRLG
jgi:protein-S-isoprenylcysteine O-methyltransferase Ste14